jgi:NADH pyrophosphatase NudC (nudix superfamily)
VRYFTSQPWPFPSSLMIGCFTAARSRALEVDRVELEDARWFSRVEALALLERRHPTASSRQSRWPSPSSVETMGLRRRGVSLGQNPFSLAGLDP